MAMSSVARPVLVVVAAFRYCRTLPGIVWEVRGAVCDGKLELQMGVLAISSTELTGQWPLCCGGMGSASRRGVKWRRLGVRPQEAEAVVLPIGVPVGVAVAVAGA